MCEKINDELVKRIIKIGAISRISNASIRIEKTEDEWERIINKPLHILHVIVTELGVIIEDDYTHLMDHSLFEVDLKIIDQLLNNCYRKLL